MRLRRVDRARSVTSRRLEPQAGARGGVEQGARSPRRASTRRRGASPRAGVVVVVGVGGETSTSRRRRARHRVASRVGRGGGARGGGISLARVRSRTRRRLDPGRGASPSRRRREPRRDGRPFVARIRRAVPPPAGDVPRRGVLRTRRPGERRHRRGREKWRVRRRGGAVRRLVDGGLAQIERGHRAPRGAGVSVAVRKAAALASAAAGGVSRVAAAAATDVVVCSRGGGGLLAERLTLASELWAAGVRAEVVPATSPSATEQFAHAAERGARVMVTVDAALLSAGERVRVRSLVKGASESDVPRAEVVEILRQMLVSRGGGTGRREVVGTKEASRTNIPPRPSTSDNISARSAQADESSNSRRQFQLQASTIRRVDRRVRTRRRARL